MHADVPRATYRLQLHRGFTFAQATELVPYLAALGVSHAYLSPYFKARPGSAHGYDIVDHNALNPEIGARADLERLCAALRAHGMGQVVDIVPNHMGVLGSDNERWLDVLEHGRASRYANFFDIDWERAPDELGGKLLLPVLADGYGTVLARGEIALEFHAGCGSFALRYFEQRFPLDPRTYSQILAPAAERLRENDAAVAGEIDGLLVVFSAAQTEADQVPELLRTGDRVGKRRLAELCARSPAARRRIDDEVREINGRVGDAASFDRLHALIAAQAYRIASWRMAADDINYRRFVDVNDLAALRMEDPAVFEETHRLLFELVAAGQVNGLRVDHADGLYDPGQYFERLQHRAAGANSFAQPDESEPAGASRGPLYLVMEKVLAPDERLPESWPIAGSTGYDFADLVNGLFVDSRAQARVTRTYFGFLREQLDFGEIAYRSKRLIMGVAVASELSALASRASRIAQADRTTCDFTYASLRAALAEITASFPAYRTYVTGDAVSEQDRDIIDRAVRAARRRAVASERTVFDFLREALNTDLAARRPPSQRAGIVEFAMRFQQFCAPVTAKGLEDTAFYRYNRLVSLNEVGGDPQRFGVSVAEFHRANVERAKAWPHTMLATSTHDSKRSEDVRARIDALSELTAEWRLHAARWGRLNRARRRKRQAIEAPSRNDEYLVYQTLVGAWPGGELGSEAQADFRQRIEGYLLKVVREEKSASSWLNPDEEYEAALIGFARQLLTPPGNRSFMESFVPFQRRVAWFGMLNSVAQTLLKLASPGVPDIYQGCERWNLSLVDPDNRRPVDHAANRESLQAMQSAAAAGEGALARLVRDLLARLEDGRVKQFITWRALELRRERPVLFRDGAYVPLAVFGTHADHVCAFARVLDGECVVAVVPRLACTLMRGEPLLPVGATVWGDTRIALSQLPYPRDWRDALTGARVASGDALPLSSALAVLPVALLAGSK